MNEYEEAMLDAIEGLGHIIFKDDAPDFEDPARRFSYFGIPGAKDHPSPVHHWQVGLLMMGGAKLVRTIAEFADAFGDEDPLDRLEALRAEIRRRGF